MQGEVGVGPGAEHGVGLSRLVIGGDRGVAEGGRGELRLDPGQHLLIDTGEQRADLGKARLDLLAHGVDPVFVHGDLDAGLVLVVAAAKRVVDADDGLHVGQQILFGQEIPDDLPDHRGPAKTAADKHLVARFPGGVADHAHADVMGAGHGEVVRRSGDRELELARQELEFGVIG